MWVQMVDWFHGLNCLIRPNPFAQVAVLVVRMTTLTHRGKRAAETTVVERRDPDDEHSEGANLSEEENDYDSSKDLRLTLMEEVLLLGLKDKEVQSRTLELIINVYFLFKWLSINIVIIIIWYIKGFTNDMFYFVLLLSAYFLH